MKYMLDNSSFVSLLVVTFSVFFLVGCGDYEVRKPTAGSTVVAFGDSLTEGVGATPGNSYVDQLSDELGFEVINAGVRGDTTFDALDRFTQDVLYHDPRIVIIMLGGNDGLQNKPAADTFTNLEFFIDKLHEQGAGVILVGIRGGLQNGAYKKRFPALAEEKRVAYVPDILDGIFRNDDLMADTIHPNDKGYAIFVEKLAPVVREMLE